MKQILIENMGKVNIGKYTRHNNLNLQVHSKLTKNELIKRIVNYNHLKSFLELNEENIIYTINPIELISPLNFDVFIKYIYTCTFFVFALATIFSCCILPTNIKFGLPNPCLFRILD